MMHPTVVREWIVLWDYTNRWRHRKPLDEAQSGGTVHDYGVYHP
jgi:hypothetical protein